MSSNDARRGSRNCSANPNPADGRGEQENPTSATRNWNRRWRGGGVTEG
jgi:hypothetical protein